MLKSIVKINFQEFFSSKNFLFFSVTIIFLLSIFLRSTVDFGGDSGFYLNLGKKIFEGKKYYYDFFEGNFPLAFYLYALEYKISLLSGISPLILAEIIINLLGILAIIYSANILKKTTIYNNKIEYNFIIIACFLGFFLRPHALTMGEFGTKTSLFLLLFFPYLSYSFSPKNNWNKGDLVCRGTLMGLIPCLKPHYLIVIIFIEFFHFWQSKKNNFFFKLDKLLMLLIGLAYLVLMLKFTPEFFEFIVPMWPKIYSPYSDSRVFLNGALGFLSNKVIIFSFIFLIFAKLKADFNDKILAISFASIVFLILLEGLGSVDQMVIFYAITTICFAKFICTLILSEKVKLNDNKFVIFAFIILPFFDPINLPGAFFAIGGLVEIWWIVVLILPFYLKEKYASRIAIFYFLLFLCGLFLIHNYANRNIYLGFNLAALLLSLAALEIRFKKSQFSVFSIVAIAISLSFLLNNYVISIVKKHNIDSHYGALSYYGKTYAPKEKDSFLIFSFSIFDQFPLINYLQKENLAKFHFVSFSAQQSSKSGEMMMYDIKDRDASFTFSYLMEDMKKQLKNKNIKVVIVSNSPKNSDVKGACYIGYLEYYFSDIEFRKLFFENFEFVNWFYDGKKFDYKNYPQKGSFYAQKIGVSTEYMDKNFEIYVRKN